MVVRSSVSSGRKVCTAAARAAPMNSRTPSLTSPKTPTLPQLSVVTTGPPRSLGHGRDAAQPASGLLLRRLPRGPGTLPQLTARTRSGNFLEVGEDAAGPTAGAGPSQP